MLLILLPLIELLDCVVNACLALLEVEKTFSQGICTVFCSRQ